MISKNITIHACAFKRYCMYEMEKMYSNQQAVVACTMNDVDPNVLSNVAFLHVKFADVISRTHPDRFTVEQAKQILSFVDQLGPGITDLYFCCDSGESRSTALAAAFMRYLGQSQLVVWKNPQYHPNGYVYSVQCKACGMLLPQLYVRHLEKVNQRAFRKQIRLARRKE